MSIDAVLGGLVGSILTVIVTKVFDLVQTGREHRYALQKSFFEKKLKAAEAAAAQWYSLGSSLGGLAALYERMSSKEKELELEVFRVMNQSLWARLKEISQASNEIANSVLLYFDIDESGFWDYEPLKKFIDSVSSLQALDASYTVMSEVYNRSIGTKYEELAFKEVKRILDEFKPHFKDLSTVLEQGLKEMTILLKKLRTEMREFEP
jgi:hypothetical protein